jgi:hypothetical protein
MWEADRRRRLAVDVALDVEKCIDEWRKPIEPQYGGA